MGIDNEYENIDSIEDFVFNFGPNLKEFIDIGNSFVATEILIKGKKKFLSLTLWIPRDSNLFKKIYDYLIFNETE